MEQERPPQGDWDLKLTPGGLVDIEFAAQYLQLVGAAAGGPLEANTGAALAALAAAGAAPAALLVDLSQAWTLQQDVGQLLKVALADGADPAQEPNALKGLLARAGGVKTLPALSKRLAAAQGRARAAYAALLGDGSSPTPR
jgi:glutamate-ammonia-ligase adenylyltransferase